MFLPRYKLRLMITPKFTNTVRRPFSTARWITYSREMMSTKDSHKIKEIKHEIFRIYENAVSSVKPGKLVSRVISKCNENTYVINGRKYHLEKNVYVVGFGKAVLDMAVQVNAIFGNHIVQGILSVPEGTVQSPETKVIKQNNIQVREGAAGNLPDKKAESTARAIANLADSLQENAILVVLISGGGSALLPAPLLGITVEETARLVIQLQSKGASIYELNSVRKKLCTLKGGGLAVRAYPARVVSLILSDVIGDSLDFIASGPTVENTDPKHLPLDIIKKYKLQNEFENNIMQALQKMDDPPSFPHEHVHNILIGSNKTALESAKDIAEKANNFPVIMSDKIDIPVAELSEWYALLCYTFCESLKCNNFEELKVFLEEAVMKYKLSSSFMKVLLDFAPKFNDSEHKGLCLIAGGEPTVMVNNICCGKGGRSQELALRFSVKMHELNGANMHGKPICVLMAAGTDGIDGPTDAAGGFGYSQQIYLANEKGLNPKEYIQQSNSYGYFSHITEDLIKIGHTGTNVMDIHILLIQK